MKLLSDGLTSLKLASLMSGTLGADNLSNLDLTDTQLVEQNRQADQNIQLLQKKIQILEAKERLSQLEAQEKRRGEPGVQPRETFQYSGAFSGDQRQSEVLNPAPFFDQAQATSS